MPGPSNHTEAYWLDADLDRTSSGGKFRLALYKHATGTSTGINVVPDEDGSLPTNLTELTGNGYSSPVVNDSGVSANTQWNAATPGAPTTKTAPVSGSFSFGTFTAAPTTGTEAVVAMAIIDRVTRASISLTTSNASPTVSVGGGATVTNADLGRAVGATSVGTAPSGAIGIPTGAVIGAIVSSTSFTMYKNGAPVNASSGGTASVTLGEIIKYAFPYFDSTITYTSVNASTPNVTTVNGSNVVNFASALTNGRHYEGAIITGPNIPASTQLLFVSADGLSGYISAPVSGAGSSGACTITGKATSKVYSVNDNPLIDTTNPLTVKVGEPSDPF